MNILKIFTYAGCSQDYWDHIISYPSNEDSVAVKGYGVDDSNPENAERQFKATAEYYGNERKNHLNQYMISFTRETVPDAETAMAINDEFLKPLKDNHLILAGLHKKHTERSDYHMHNYVSTTNLKNGKMLNAKNENNFPMAQHLANITQQEVLLVIEKRKPNSLEIDHSRKPYEKVFKPQKNKK